MAKDYSQMARENPEAAKAWLKGGKPWKPKGTGNASGRNDKEAQAQSTRTETSCRPQQ